MSVIQQIRDKYARLAVIAIALALMGFLLMDAFVGKSRLFGGGSSTTIGKVNGTKIGIDDFRKKVKQQEDNMQQQGRTISEDERQQLIGQMWDMEVNRVLVQNETDKLGMKVETKELDDILFGNNPPEDIKRIGTDQQTGQYSTALAIQRINSIKKSGTATDKEMLNNFFNQLEIQRLAEKYTSLLGNSINFPKWFIEKTNTDNSLLAKISYVKMFYTDSSFVDSTIKISDKEIEDYIQKHKDDFKQEESRSMAYVSFSAAANAADTLATKKQVEELKPEFDTTKNVEAFLARNASSIDFDDTYKSKEGLRAAYKDSVLSLKKNEVFGPYLAEGSYILAKMLEIRTLPDSVKARHILIQTTNPQNGQQILDDSIAKRRIDSIALAIKHGAKFDSLAKLFSDDKGSAAKGGLVQVQFMQGGPMSDYFVQGQMVKAFNDSCFFGKTGETKIVKSEFGYHLIQILDQKKIEPHYKVAYMAKTIEPSAETDRDADNAAAEFAADSRSLKSFDDNFEKNLKVKGFHKAYAANIKPNDYSVTGLGTSRQFVKDIYDADAGDVLQPERVGDQYVVAAITEVNKEGTMSVAKARIYVEPILRNKKKAELIENKIGKITTLEAAAAALNKKIETKDSLRMTTGFDNRVTGAAFNPANKGKVVPEPIEGSSGVFVVRVDSVTATSVDLANVPEQQKSMYANAKQSVDYPDPRNPNYPINVLRKAASVKDYRTKFY